MEPGMGSNLKSNGVRCAVIAAMILLTLLPALPVLAAVVVKADRLRVVEGETVTLTFQSNDPGQSLEADFGPLERDFEILDRRTETQLSIVNGEQTALVRLVLTVEPRRSGDLQVPALDFDGSRTRPLDLRVDPAPEPEPGAVPPVFIETEITPRDGPHYVNAQLGLTVRVFYQQNLTEAAISQPEPSPASVRLLQETPYQAERGGKRYRVLERRYAIFPERSGPLSLPAMQLSGRLVERGSSSIWQPSVRGRRVEVASEPLELQILPRPVAAGGKEWQPARAYSLSQQVSNTRKLRVGEPVTRTVIIDAIGLEDNMIAEPEWPDLPGTRIYPDQPQGISRDDGQWVLGHKEFRYAVVPEQEGELVLPELRVHWWDTVNDREQTAVLPARTLSVLPSSLVPAPPPEAIAAPDGQFQAPAPTGPGVRGEPGYWRWVAALFAALWLATLLGWGLYSRRKRETAPATAGRLTAADETTLLATLRESSRRGDAPATRLALLAWLREFGPARSDGSRASLLEFAAGCDDEALSRETHALDAAGFRPAGETAATSWEGKRFWTAFEDWRKSRTNSRGQQTASLTDLWAK